MRPFRPFTLCVTGALCAGTPPAAAATYTTLYYNNPGLTIGMAYPKANLVFGADGYIYSTDSAGGSKYAGLLFRIPQTGEIDGSGYSNPPQVLCEFSGARRDGGTPLQIVSARDGHIYGVTGTGGTAGVGTFYRLDWSSDTPQCTTLAQFAHEEIGYAPNPALIQLSDGNFYGLANNVLYRVGLHGRHATVTDLRTFGNAYLPDPTEPFDLVDGGDGYLYGSSELGGYGTAGLRSDLIPACHADAAGCGAIFRIRPDGTGYEIVHYFSGGAEGFNPTGLFRSSSGRIWGSTLYTAGALWSFDPRAAGSGYDFQVAVSFSPPYFNPAGGLAESGGSIYGYAATGGGTACPRALPYCTVIYQYQPSTNTVSIAHAFDTTIGGPDEVAPLYPLVGGPTSLVQGPDAALYGVGVSGGFRVLLGGIYKLTP